MRGHSLKLFKRSVRLHTGKYSFSSMIVSEWSPLMKKLKAFHNLLSKLDCKQYSTLTQINAEGNWINVFVILPRSSFFPISSKFLNLTISSSSSSSDIFLDIWKNNNRTVITLCSAAAAIVSYTSITFNIHTFRPCAGGPKNNNKNNLLNKILYALPVYFGYLTESRGHVAASVA